MDPQIKILYINSPKYDYNTATLIQGFRSIDGVEVKGTCKGNYIADEMHLNTEDAIAYGNKEADVIVLGNNHYVLKDIYNAINKQNKISVFVDGLDNANVNASYWDIKSFDYVFKREFYMQDNSFSTLLNTFRKQNFGLWKQIRAHKWVPFPYYHTLNNYTPAREFVRNLFISRYTDKFFPMPLGIEERAICEFNENPALDFSCLINPHFKERKEFVDYLQNLNPPNSYVGVVPADDVVVLKETCSPDLLEGDRRAMHVKKYYQIMNNSRASVSLPGGGFDSQRFWEILASGSLLISKRISLNMPYPFEEGKHYLAFDNLKEFHEALDRVYKEPKEIDKIRRQGYEFAIKYHTTRARALFFLNKILEKSNPELARQFLIS